MQIWWFPGAKIQLFRFPQNFQVPKLRFPQNFYYHNSGFPQNFHFFALLQESPSAHWLNRTALKLSDSTQTYKQAGDDSIELCPVNDRHIGWIHNKRNENGCVLAYIFIYGGIINLTATRGCVKSNWHTLFVDYTVEHHSSTWSTTSPS